MNTMTAARPSRVARIVLGCGSVLLTAALLVGCAPAQGEAAPSTAAPVGLSSSEVISAPTSSEVVTVLPPTSSVGSSSSSAGSSSSAPSSSAAPSSTAPSSSAPSSAPSSSAPSSSAAPSSAPPSSTPSSSAPSTSPQTPTTAAPTTAAPAVLRAGSSGPAVLQLQRTLDRLGYWNGTPDGTFGELTTQAVMAYQAVAGLDVDGVAGPMTLRAVQQELVPTPRTRTGDALEVDKQRQIVLVVEGGRLRTVLHTSTGSGETFTTPGEPGESVATTPSGEFTVQRAIDGMRVSKLGKLWRPRYFNGGIAFHGAGSVPNYPASHGCVRLTNAAIDLLWSQDLAPIGRTVLVY